VDDGGVVAGIGGWGNGSSDAVGTARQRRPLSEGSRRGLDAVGPWFGPGGWRWAPRGFDFFQFNQNQLKLGIRKRTHYPTPKIPKFCMLVDWGTMNNSLNCSGIQISTKLELKFLEQIHHLKLWWIFKGV
jgi:hypothetical protein